MAAAVARVDACTGWLGRRWRRCRNKAVTSMWRLGSRPASTRLADERSHRLLIGWKTAGTGRRLANDDRRRPSASRDDKPEYFRNELHHELNRSELKISAKKPKETLATVSVVVFSRSQPVFRCQSTSHTHQRLASLLPHCPPPPPPPPGPSKHTRVSGRCACGNGRQRRRGRKGRR